MKRIVKQTTRLAFLLITAPLRFGYGCQVLCMGQARAITGWSQLLGLVPGLGGVYLREAFFRGVLPYVGSDCVISFGVLFSSDQTSIGRLAYIGPYSVLGDVEIGEDVLLGSQVSLMNGSQQHGIERLDVPVREQPGHWPRLTIGRDSWIGDRAIVMADVGIHCVVGAGSVVTKPVPDYAIVVGNPARIIKFRNDMLNDSLPATPDLENVQ